MTISGERTEQLDIFCRISGFTSDFLSFIDVELIWFFHGALQLYEGRLIIKLQNGAVPLILKIGKIRNMSFREFNFENTQKFF